MKQRSIAELADEFLQENLDLAVSTYLTRNRRGGTLAISSDAARELLPGYSNHAERLRNNFALGPASSKLADAVWQLAMTSGPTPERYVVEFLTGSPGSGKTSSYIDSTEKTPLAIISESMMDNFERSAIRINQAIEAGFVAALRLVYADDPAITLRRAVARTMAFGRPVAISQMSRLYVEIPKTVAQLQRKFGDNLGVMAFDNSRDGALPQPTTVEAALRATSAYTESTAKEAMLHELDELRNHGKTSTEVYEKFRGALPSAHRTASS